MKQLSATRELHRPDDAKGLVFRIQPSSVLEAQFAMLGATAKQLSYAETLKAMQAGSVQAPRTPGRTSPDRRSTACSRTSPRPITARSATC